jgi:hypothetical protein
LERRWQAAAEVRAAGLAVGLCLTPLLPLSDPAAFAQRVAAFRPDVLVVQDFHDAGGRFGADTRDEARQLLSEWKWSPVRYAEFVGRLRDQLTPLYEGESGFYPP